MANLDLETYNPDRVGYVVWKFGDDQPEINIDGKDLIYAQIGETHHGLQCVVSGDEQKHNEILSKMKQIAKLFKEVNELNKL